MSEYCCRNDAVPAATPVAGCIGRSATQCVDVIQPVVLTPTASLGTVVASCTGTPSVTCVTAADGASCTVTLTQRVCVSIPVSYGVDVVTDDPSIACADSTAGEAAVCGCGC